jgi:hypothetical protein
MFAQQKHEATETPIEIPSHNSSTLINVSNILVKQDIYEALETGSIALLTNNQHGLAFTVRK